MLSLFSLQYDIYWHLPPMFRPNNFRRNPTDIFKNTALINMICAPRELDMPMPALRKITGPADRPAVAIPG
ncbi:MAG: hypothetical protein NUV72_01740, partial [Bauldia sp.]|nr:hypothetical protein [Bauldia sp.]